MQLIVKMKFMYFSAFLKKFYERYISHSWFYSGVILLFPLSNKYPIIQLDKRLREKDDLNESIFIHQNEEKTAKLMQGKC